MQGGGAVSVFEVWVRHSEDYPRKLVELEPESLRIIICAVAGFQLDDAERRHIKPAYLKLLEELASTAPAREAPK